MEEPVRKLGPYTLIKKIGRGAFGVVWLAEKQTAIATTRFALKLSRDEDIDLEAFKNEATIWVQASGHPNVVSLIEADIYEGQVVLVSEYVADGSLASWLQQHGGKAPSIASACEMIDGILDGLAHLHERRIIHRDLKPDNILLRRTTPCLADFGIARILRSGSYSTNISGTLAYMAPEAFDGKRNEQTDIWAVGVILYQLLVGRLPYAQTDTVSFIGAIMRHDPAPLPDSVPEVLRRAVEKALRRDPRERYLTAKAMSDAVREAERMMWFNERDLRSVASVPINNNATLLFDSSEKVQAETSQSGSIDNSQRAGTITAGMQFQQTQSNEATEVPPNVLRETVAASNERPSVIPVETITALNLRPLTAGPTPGKPTVGGKPATLRNVILGIVFVLVIGLIGVFWILSGISNAQQKAQAEQDLRDVRAAIDRVRGQGFKNKLGMEFALIPAGSFLMGSDTGEDEEKPVHRVTISKDFYVSKTEVTQQQWNSVIRYNPSYYIWPTHPVDSVSWTDAQSFIEMLNQLNDGYKYRLPTEAEWEYACRAGTTGDFAGELNSMGWYKENSTLTMQEVAQKQPNAFGLYDMHGNAEEWCQDSFETDFYQNGPAVDPQGPKQTSIHVVRGGAFSFEASQLRSSARSSNDKFASPVIQGFRVVAIRVN